MPETFVPNRLDITDAAIEKILQLQEQESNLGSVLRLFVEGGGCAGFKYGFKLDDSYNQDDTVIEKLNKKLLVVDELSLPLVAGATVDYEVGLMGAKFVLRNLNATTTCSCGISFSV